VRSSIGHATALLVLLGLVGATAAATAAALETPAPPATATAAATLTPAVTPRTTVPSPTAMTSSVPSPSHTRAASTSPRPTLTAADADPTPVATRGGRDDDAAASETPAPWAAPTPPPAAGAVRAFRTPDREAPPAFVAPQAAPTENADEPPLDEPLPEATRLPDRPYVGTVTFHAVAAADDVEQLDLIVIYPRAAGDFVGSGDRVDCRTSADATLFADDRDDGMLRLVVAGGELTFPLDVVCRFAVDVQATLYSGLIAVTVAEVTVGGTRGDPSLVSVTVDAH
jgi:hypothetical protein